MKEVLNGGYNVHPVPPPNSEIKETKMKVEHMLIEDFSSTGWTLETLRLKKGLGKDMKGKELRLKNY